RHSDSHSFFLSLLPTRPPPPALFPYTTLFRSQPRDGLRVRTHHRARQDLADSENTDDRDDRIDSLEKSEAAERETGQPRLQFDSHRRDRDADDDGGQTEH